MTLFSALLSGLGLSQSEAAEFLEVRIDTVKSWCAGRRNPPAGAMAQLHALAARQIAAADALVQSCAEAKRAAGGDPDAIEAALPSDAEIRRRGWPCRGAFLAVVRRAWETLPDGTRIVLVTAGSTEAVRGAEAARGA